MDDFPADLKQFITGNVSSVAQLEALLMLRDARHKSWTPDEVGRALYISAEIVSLQLAELQKHGLLEIELGSPPHYCYKPRTHDLERKADQLAAMYKERRVSVITLIYSQPLDKVRTLADAFKFRRES